MAFQNAIKRWTHTKKSVITYCAIRKNSTETSKTMNKQIAWVTWSRGRYSDIFRTAIVEPSPIKEGQRVHVIWGKSKKEYSAVLTCYPLVEEPASTPVQQALPQHRAKAKRKLVSRIFLIFTVPLFPFTVNVFIYSYYKLMTDDACGCIYAAYTPFFSWLTQLNPLRKRQELKRQGSQQRSQQRRNQKERYVFYNYYVFR